MSASTMSSVSLLKPGMGCQVTSARPTECDRNEYQVECGGGEGEAFPGPVAVAHECDVEDDQRNKDCSPGRDSEETEAGADGDELRDESEEVSDAEVDHGKPSPEGAEAVEDKFGVSAMRGGSEADGHFLDNDRHAKCQSHKRQEKTDAEFGARRGVGEHAGAVILPKHDEDARTDQQPEKAGSGEKAAPGAGF
jgi:hypothetical protein